VARYGGQGSIRFDNGTLTTGGLLARPVSSRVQAWSMLMVWSWTLNWPSTVTSASAAAHVRHPALQNITINLNVDGSARSAPATRTKSLSIAGVCLWHRSMATSAITPLYGTATVDGAGSVWINSGGLYIGEGAPARSTSRWRPGPQRRRCVPRSQLRFLGRSDG